VSAYSRRVNLRVVAVPAAALVSLNPPRDGRSIFVLLAVGRIARTMLPSSGTRDFAHESMRRVIKLLPSGWTICIVSTMSDGVSAIVFCERYGRDRKGRIDARKRRLGLTGRRGSWSAR